MEKEDDKEEENVSIWDAMGSRKRIEFDGRDLMDKSSKEVAMGGFGNLEDGGEGDSQCE